MNELFFNEAEVDAFGFKFMYGQNRRYPQVRQWCKEHGVKVIHLVRKNALKAIVSRHIAKKRGIYMSTKPLEPVRTKLKPRKLVAEIRKAGNMVEKNRVLFSACPYLEVFYEDFVIETGEISKRILNFLETDESQQLTCDLVKTNIDALGPLVENYQEVCKALSGSPYEQLLD